MTLCNVCGQVTVDVRGVCLYKSMHNLVGTCLFEPIHGTVVPSRPRVYTANVQAFKEGLSVVNHPSHYGGDTPHETIKCLEAWGLESDALLWNAVKYISRAGKKSPATMLEDLEKASFYLRRRIAVITGVPTTSTSRQLEEAAASPSTSTQQQPKG